MAVATLLSLVPQHCFTRFFQVLEARRKAISYQITSLGNQKGTSLCLVYVDLQIWDFSLLSEIHSNIMNH